MTKYAIELFMRKFNETCNCYLFSLHILVPKLTMDSKEIDQCKDYMILP